jgi:hypothetical protein
VVWWCGGVVVWWCGGVVVWWCGGVVVWCYSGGLRPQTPGFFWGALPPRYPVMLGASGVEFVVCCTLGESGVECMICFLHFWARRVSNSCVCCMCCASHVVFSFAILVRQASNSFFKRAV